MIRPGDQGMAAAKRAVRAGRPPARGAARAGGGAPAVGRTTPGAAPTSVEAAAREATQEAAGAAVASTAAPTAGEAPRARPFARRRTAPDASTPELYRVAMAYEGRTDERAFRAVAAREGCEVVEEGGRLAMRAGLLLMARLDPRTGRAESRHDFPDPAPQAVGHWCVEVRDEPRAGGATPFRVRWTSRATGRSDEATIEGDLDRFVREVARCGNVVTVVGHDGARTVTRPPREAWDGRRG